MLTGTSNFQDMIARVVAAQASKKDYIADTRTCTVQVLDRVPRLEIADVGQFDIAPLARNQITARCGIPQKYAEKMLSENAEDLYATNVNAWFRINPEKRMVRTIMQNALAGAASQLALTRAFLSNRYQRIEHEEIAAVALPILSELPGVQIPSCEVTDRRMYIHFVVPGIQGEVKVGDVVQAGGIISNSETGEGSVRVEGLTWRLRCLNGMKSGDTFRRNHVGRQIDDTSELWADDTRKADDKAVLLKVRDMVRAVTDETRFRAHLAKLRGLTEGPAVANPVEAVRVLAAKIDASESEQAGILKSFCESGDFSRWGLLNAVTAQAHTAADYDRAVELEGAGGSLVDLPASDWKEILQAA